MLEVQISYLNQVSYYSCTCWQGRVPAQGYIYLTVTGTSRFILPSIWTLTFCDGSVIHKHLFIQVTHLAFYAFMLGIETKVFFHSIFVTWSSCWSRWRVTPSGLDSVPASANWHILTVLLRRCQGCCSGWFSEGIPGKTQFIQILTNILGVFFHWSHP